MNYNTNRDMMIAWKGSQRLLNDNRDGRVDESSCRNVGAFSMAIFQERRVELLENQDFDLVDGLRRLLSVSVTDRQQRQRAKELGLDPEKLCNGMLLVISLFDAAKNGNMTAIREILNLLEKGSADREEVRIIDDISS